MATPMMATPMMTDLNEAAIDELQAGVRLLAYYIEREGSGADHDLLEYNLRALAKLAKTVYDGREPDGPPDLRPVA